MRDWIPVAIAVAAVGASTLPRALLAADVLPPPARYFVWSDAIVIHDLRLADGRLPYSDAFFEYPPVIGYISALLALLAPGRTSFVVAWGVICAASAGVVALVIARTSGVRSALLWSLSPQLLLYSGLNFDALAVVPLVAGVALGRRDRPLPAMAALAVGLATKAFPALAAPAMVQEVWRRGRRTLAAAALGVFALVTLALTLPALLAPYPLAASAAFLGARVNFDSVWGMALAGMGSIPYADTVALFVSTIGMVATYVWVLRRVRGHDIAIGAALGIIAVLLWARLYSPQYSLWVVPFFALGVLSRRAFALLCAADVVIFLTVSPLTLAPWGGNEVAPIVLFGVLAGGIVMRHIALIAALVSAIRRLRGSEREVRPATSR